MSNKIWKNEIEKPRIKEKPAFLRIEYKYILVVEHFF